MKHLISILILFFLFCSNVFSQRKITVDFQQEVGTIKNLLGVNRGPDAKLQGYLDGGVTSIRLHDDRASDYQNYSDFWNFDPATNKFTTINTGFDPENPDHYNWLQLDSRINTIVNNGMEVYFRLGISWPDNPGFPTPPLTPPLDPDGFGFTKFAELCRRTVLHYNHAWANGFAHNVQYWEIWNEPAGEFWQGSPLQFYKMYAAASLALKSTDPNLKVGGPGALPATIVVPNDEYFKTFLQYLRDNKLPLDFYSWHLYGAENPYGVKYWAEIVRRQLDDLGFVNAESHITEINYTLAEASKLMDDNARGAAYLLSNLLTLQEAPVEKMYWYPGLALFDDDAGGQPQYNRNAYGFETFSLIYQNTPIQLQSTGSDVVEGHWDADTTNFMVTAGKSVSGDKLYLAISNYRSDYRDYNIQLTNLPWSATDQIKITTNIVREPSDSFTESTNIQAGDVSLLLSVREMPSPSVTLIRLEKVDASHINLLNTVSAHFRLEQNYPNPFNSTTAIRYELLKTGQVELSIYDGQGKKVRTLLNQRQVAGAHSVKWDGKNEQGNPVSTGVYYCQIRANHSSPVTRKMTLIK